jgi:hypothetical protein
VYLLEGGRGGGRGGRETWCRGCEGRGGAPKTSGFFFERRGERRAPHSPLFFLSGPELDSTDRARGRRTGRCRRQGGGGGPRRAEEEGHTLTIDHLDFSERAPLFCFTGAPSVSPTGAEARARAALRAVIWIGRGPPAALPARGGAQAVAKEGAFAGRANRRGKTTFNGGEYPRSGLGWPGEEVAESGKRTRKREEEGLIGTERLEGR